MAVSARMKLSTVTGTEAPSSAAARPVVSTSRRKNPSRDHGEEWLE
jgi:hypothetical protein